MMHLFRLVPAVSFILVLLGCGKLESSYLADETQEQASQVDKGNQPEKEPEQQTANEEGKTNPFGDKIDKETKALTTTPYYGYLTYNKYKDPVLDPDGNPVFCHGVTHDNPHPKNSKITQRFVRFSVLDVKLKDGSELDYAKIYPTSGVARELTFEFNLKESMIPRLDGQYEFDGFPKNQTIMTFTKLPAVFSGTLKFEHQSISRMKELSLEKGGNPFVWIKNKTVAEIDFDENLDNPPNRRTFPIGLFYRDYINGEEVKRLNCSMIEEYEPFGEEFNKINQDSESLSYAEKLQKYSLSLYEQELKKGPETSFVAKLFVD